MTSIVFVYPEQLEFTPNNKTQTISIFNPYDFAVRFDLRCTNPKAFSLSSTGGQIPLKHSIDVVITIVDLSIENEQFQIKISSCHSKSKKLGDKIVDVIFTQSRPTRSKHALNEVDCETIEYSSVHHPHKYKATHNERVPNQYLIYFIIAVCTIILMMHHEEGHGSTYYYFQVSVTLKIVAAYVLGIVTVFLIRS